MKTNLNRLALLMACASISPATAFSGEKPGDNSVECARSAAAAKADFAKVAAAIADSDAAQANRYSMILEKVASDIESDPAVREALESQAGISQLVNQFGARPEDLDWETIDADARFNADVIADAVGPRSRAELAKMCGGRSAVRMEFNTAPGVVASCDPAGAQVSMTELSFGRYIEFSRDPGTPELRFSETRKVELGKGLFSKSDEVTIVNEIYRPLGAGFSGSGLDQQLTVRVRGADGEKHTLYGFGGLEHEFIEVRVGAACAQQLSQTATPRSADDAANKPWKNARTAEEAEEMEEAAIHSDFAE